MHRFTVDASDPDRPRVTVGGRRQRGVDAVTVRCERGRRPELHLRFADGGGRFDGEADVWVATGDPWRAAAFLDGVDPKQLERDALALDEAHGPMSPGEMFLGALRAMCAGPETDMGGAEA